MYPDHFATEISEKIGRPLSGIYRMAQLLGLKSSPEKYRRAAEKVVSNPNHIASRFKKGNVPKCHRPVGSERVNVDGYVEVKVADSIIDIYKVQVDALKTVAHMDHMNSPENILVGMGVTGAEEVKMIS